MVLVGEREGASQELTISGEKAISWRKVLEKVKGNVLYIIAEQVTLG